MIALSELGADSDAGRHAGCLPELPFSIISAFSGRIQLGKAPSSIRSAVEKNGCSLAGEFGRSFTPSDSSHDRSPDCSGTPFREPKSPSLALDKGLAQY